MTLRANELRIRNFVTIDNKDSWPEMRDIPVIVTALKGHMDEDDMRMFPNSRGEVHVLHGKDLYSQFDEFIKPIPLTEEWLIRFGFEPNGVFKSMRIAIDPLTNEGSRTFIVCTFDEEGWIEIISKTGASQNPIYSEEQSSFLPLRFVHQLQNLYFALTGEELPLANHPI